MKASNFDEGFRADLLVEESVLVEIKAVEKNHPVHARQLRTHLVLAKASFGTGPEFWLGTAQRRYYSDRKWSAGVR
jgi:GxxExxY protein